MDGVNEAKTLLADYPAALEMHLRFGGQGPSFSAGRTINLKTGKFEAGLGTMYYAQSDIIISSKQLKLSAAIILAKESITFIGMSEVRCDGSYIIAPKIFIIPGSISEQFLKKRLEIVR